MIDIPIGEGLHFVVPRLEETEQVCPVQVYIIRYISVSYTHLKFYQFWLNVSDADAARYIKIFTSLSREEIEALTAEHETAPHLRVLQKRLAKEVTIMVHSEEDYNAAVDASNIL